MDDAYPILVPVNGDNVFDQCRVQRVEADFFASVVYNSAKQIEGFSNYCGTISEQLGNSITVVLTSYDTEVGFTKNSQDEIDCYLLCVLPNTRQGEAILVKRHPRQRLNQPHVLAEKLCESGRNPFVVSEFTQVPRELFVSFLK